MRKKKAVKDEVTRVLRIKKCAVCGKTFCRINYNDYAYKNGMTFFCGYTCMQIARRAGQLKQAKIVKL